MIKYNNSNINDWYFYTSDIVKVYRNNAVCYYKIISSGDTPTQVPCFAVVDDISQYSDTEFEDVFNKADGKWYKLNNLNQYEEYGVYGSGRNITYYEGKLTIDDGYEYMYSGSSWQSVGEVSGSTATLPNVPFMLNYNAKNYDSTTHSIAKTSGQTKDVNAVCNYGYRIVDNSTDGYITVTGNTRMLLSGSTYLGRNDTQTGCTMTIVSKARTSSGYSILTNRGRSGRPEMNWMWRYPTDGIFLHGSSSYSSAAYHTSTNTKPIIASVRTYYDGGVKQTINDWTNNGSYSGNFGYGENYNGNSALFCDYASSNSEFWQGDFYWVYMSQSVLTDEQIQQVINYNESSGGTVEYPMYYDELQDPPDNLSFSSMTEAESYECPWVGLHATIAGDKYIFSGNSQSGYEWIYNPSRLPAGYTEVEYIENFSSTSVSSSYLAYLNTNFYPTEKTRTVANIQVMKATQNPRYFGSGNWNALGYIVSQEWTIGEDRARIYCKYGNSSGWIETDYVPNMGRHVYDHNNNGKLVIDNVDIVSLPTTAFTCTRPMAIFTAIQNTGSVDLNETIYGRLYSFKIYENDTLVRDLIPCIRDNDITAGVYDIINDVFYSSANENKFVAGNPV